MNHSIYRCSQMSGDSSIIWRKVRWALGHCCWQVPWEGRGWPNIWCCFKTHILLILISSLTSALHTSNPWCVSKAQSWSKFLSSSKSSLTFHFSRLTPDPTPLMATDLSSSQSQSYAPVCCSLYPTGIPLESRQCWGFSPSFLFQGRLSNCWHPSRQV